MGDAFDDTCEFDTSGWHAREQLARANDGFREGLEVGQERTLQAGFNEGFCEAMRLSFQLAALRGVLTALLGVHLTGSEKQKELLVQRLTLSGSNDITCSVNASDDAETVSNDNSMVESTKGGEPSETLRLYHEELVHEIEDMISRLSEGEESIKLLNNQFPLPTVSEELIHAPKEIENPIKQLQNVVNLDQISTENIKAIEGLGKPNDGKGCCKGESSNRCTGKEAIDAPDDTVSGGKGKSNNCATNDGKIDAPSDDIKKEIETLIGEANNLIKVLGMGWTVDSM